MLTNSILITSIYGALLGVLYLYLTIKTIKARRKFQIALGDGRNEILKRAIRSQANFTESVPLALLLMLMAELNHASPMMISIIGITLLVGRVLHAYGINQIPENFKFRIIGMALTFSSIVLSIIVIITQYIGTLIN